MALILGRDMPATRRPKKRKLKLIKIIVSKLPHLYIKGAL